MSLPNPGMSFTPFDPLPASDLNDMVENIEALAAGTGLNDASITAAKIVGINKSLLTTDSNPYKFKAHAAANQSAADVTATKVTFGTEDFDTNNNFASNEYTAPVAGFYQLNVGARMSTSNGVSYTMDIRKNGTTFASRLISPYPSTTTFGDVSLEYADTVQLAANDVISVYITCDTGNSSSVSIIGAAAISHTYISGHLVSRT